MTWSHFSAVLFGCLIASGWSNSASAQAPADPSQLPATEASDHFSGRVLSQDGSPIAHAGVYLLRSPEEGGYFTLPTEPLQVRSDATGNFAFQDLDEGEYRLWAENAAQTSLVQKLRGQKISVKKSVNQAAPIDVFLHAGCGFNIRVTDTSRRAIPDAKIEFAWTDIRRSYATDQVGMATIRNLAIDEWYLVVSAPGYETEFHRTSKQKLGTVLPLNFELKPGRSISGKVVDDGGSPIAGVRITVNPVEISMAPNYGQFNTDSDGQFTIDGLPMGGQVRIVAIKDNYDHVNKTITVVNETGPLQTELILNRRPYGGDILVNVVDSQGKPIEGATLLNRGNKSSDVREATTDNRGKVLMQDMYDSYAGFMVVAKAAGYIAQQQSVEVGTVERPGEVTFKMAKGSPLRGRILSPAGEPLAKLKVFWDRGENGDLLGGSIQTDVDGRFVIDGLGPTALITVYTPPEYAPIRQIPIRTDLDELMEVTLVPTGVLQCRAVDNETGLPLKSYNVRIGFCEHPLAGDLQPQGISTALTQEGTNIEGDTHEYRLTNEVVGTAFKVIVSAPGYEANIVDRMVAQAIGEATVVDVPLTLVDPENYQTIAGQLVDADGNAVAGAAVRLLVGKSKPWVNAQRLAVKGRAMGGWNFYHWGLLSADQIEGRDQCEQLLKTVSDVDGKFRFEDVKRDSPWIELFYFGEGIFAQRYSNLRERSDEELRGLTLQATRPATLTIHVDREKYPTAERVELAAEDYVSGLNAIYLPFSSENQTIGEENTFPRLPAGNYTINLQAKPEPQGDGGFIVRAVAQKTITIEADQAYEFDF